MTGEFKIRLYAPAKLKGDGSWCNVTVLTDSFVLMCADNFH